LGWADDRDRSAPNQERPEGITVTGGVGQLVIRRGQPAQQGDRKPDVACPSGAQIEVG
jgi:hypothetical protein